MPTAERRRSSLPLAERYIRDDVRVFSPQERRELGIDEHSDPQHDPSLAWELLYRVEPALYDRLVSAERVHPEVINWLPTHVDRITEIAAGSGRLTRELLSRCHELTAIEPAMPLREILARRVEARVAGWSDARPPAQVRILDGFFDALPVPDGSAELVASLSAFTPERRHGGETGLTEMERVCAPGGMVAILWPNHVEWLTQRGYRYRSFEGEMAMEFSSLEEAVELAQIFYPHAVDNIRRRGGARVPYDLLGVNPPCDLVFKTID